MIDQQPVASSIPVTVPPEDSRPCHWAWAAIIGLITLITVAFRYALPIRDGDVWFHLLYGKYFLANRTLIPDHTIFSWTPSSNDIIYCSWLSDIFLYLLYSVTGIPGLIAFRYLCVLLLVGACFLFARKLKIAANPLVWFLCLLGVIMSYAAVFEKPEILSFVFMTLVAWNWWHIRSSGEASWRHCYLFPVIMLLWVNSHGGFVFGAVFLAMIGLGELLNTWLSPANCLSPRLRKHLVLALGLAAISILVTPYGYLYPLQLLRDMMPTEANLARNSTVAAYAATFALVEKFGFALGADIVILLLLMLHLRNFKKVEWSSLLTNIVFAYLYTRFLRTTFYWVPVFLFSGISLLATPPEPSIGCRYRWAVRRLLPASILLASLWLSGLLLYNSYVMPEKWIWMGFGISENNPVAEADYIKTYFPDVRIGNTYDQGAYLLWKLWPSNRVFFDARHFPYRKWCDEFFALSNGKNVKELLAKYPCDLWCIGLANLPLSMPMLGSGEWRLAYYGKSAAVLVRKDISLPKVSKVSASVFDPKNLSGAIDCLKFACYVKDWSTAAKLIVAMNERFIYPEQQQALRLANRLYRGLSAFYSARYRGAVEQLAPLRSPPNIIRFILTSSYQYLSNEAWQQGDVNSARKYAEQAFALVPEENPYSLFNLGVIGWQQERTGGKGEGSSVWRQLLTDFLSTAPSDPEFDAVRPVVQAMLAGRQEGRPTLLLPPEPSTERSTQDVWSETTAGDKEGLD